jgi:putative transposase
MEYRKTRKAWSIPHHAHALTFSVRGRRPWLQLPGAAEAFLLALDAARVECDFELWAYVVMPEHVHIVLCPRQETYSMSAILTAIKSPSAKAILRLHPELREQGRIVRKSRTEVAFWEVGGGYDRNLFTAKEAWEKIHYTHANPIKRGLAADLFEYPWSSIGAYHDLPSPIPVDFCQWGE